MDDYTQSINMFFPNNTNSNKTVKSIKSKIERIVNEKKCVEAIMSESEDFTGAEKKYMDVFVEFFFRLYNPQNENSKPIKASALYLLYVKHCLSRRRFCDNFSFNKFRLALREMNKINPILANNNVHEVYNMTPKLPNTTKSPNTLKREVIKKKVMKDQPDPNEMYTVQQIVKNGWIKLSVSSLYRYIRLGKIEHKKIGRRDFISGSTILGWHPGKSSESAKKGKEGEPVDGNT